MSDKPAARRRPLRSFVRRDSRITPAQQAALADLWPRYGVDELAALALPERLFRRAAPLLVEIGCGNGACFAALAAARPGWNCLGVEVYKPGLGGLLRRLAEQRIATAKVVAEDAVDVLAALPDAAVDICCVFFPDPWPKKRHHKRRLLGAATAAELQRVLAAHGRLYMATDWADYAEQIAEVFDSAPGFVNLAGSGRSAPRYGGRVLTRFEERGIEAGRAIVDFAYARRLPAAGSAAAAPRQDISEVVDHREG